VKKDNVTRLAPKGVEVDQVQVWKDPDDGTVIFHVISVPGSPQIRIPAAKWEQIKEFIDGPAIES